MKKKNKTNNVGMMQSIKRASDMSPFSLEPAAPRAAYVPILLSEIEQEQRLSRNGDRQVIVVGAGLRDGEGKRANTGYAPHIKRDVSANVFSLRRFGIFFCGNDHRHVFAETSFAETSGVLYKRDLIPCEIHL